MTGEREEAGDKRQREGEEGGQEKREEREG